MHIETIPATPEHQSIMANLFELYAHDLSPFHDLDLGQDGRFGYKNLPLYWLEPNRHPYLVTIDGKLAGLILIKQGSEISGNKSVWDVAEFFVVRRYRKCGVGTHLAHDLWKSLPGQWEVRVMETNRSALHFWENAIAKFTGQSPQSVRVEKNGKPWSVFSFESF